MSAIGIYAVVMMLVVFVTAVVSKVRSRAAFGEFVNSLSQFGVAVHRRRRTVAVAVIGLEVVAVVTLVVPASSAAVHVVPAVALLIGFSLAVAVVASKRPAFTCHCFGSSSTTSVGLHLAVNGLLVLVGFVAMAVPVSGTTSAGAQLLAAGLGVISGIGAVTIGSILEALAPRMSASTKG
jgi:hypothetical protein